MFTCVSLEISSPVSRAWDSFGIRKRIESRVSFSLKKTPSQKNCHKDSICGCSKSISRYALVSIL